MTRRACMYGNPDHRDAADMGLHQRYSTPALPMTFMCRGCRTPQVTLGRKKRAGGGWNCAGCAGGKK